MCILPGVQKIPTLFDRDWDGDRSRVVDRPNPAAQWVLDGEGVATRKYDGTSCLVRDGILYKRFAFAVPPDATLDNVQAVVPTDEEFLPVSIETSPGRNGPVTKAIGWTRVGDGPEDEWHREGFAHTSRARTDNPTVLPDGTYELIGPKVQGNPERASEHQLVSHTDAKRFGFYQDPEDEESFVDGCPRDYDGLRAWLQGRDIEGVVWHHPDGRMAKVKLRDFGLSRPAAA